MGLLGLFGIGTATYKLVKETLEPTLTSEQIRYNLIKDDDVGTRVLKKQAFGWELTPEEERWYKQNFYTLKCPHCGTMNHRDYMWCDKCGKLLSETKKIENKYTKLDNKNVSIHTEDVECNHEVSLSGEEKLLGMLPVPTNQYFDFILEDSGKPNEKIIRLNDAIFVINTNDFLKIKSFYGSCNKTIDETMVKEQKLIRDLYKKIDGINVLADNLISTLDNPILLNHDTIIIMQTMWAYNKMKNTKLYDENAINNENLLMAIVLMQTLLENMAEIILESNTISKQKALFVCWEATKIAAIKYYSNIWEKDYGKYIDSILPKGETEESTKFLVQYIKKILDCNEIESIDNFNMIAIFTYHIMDKGYTKDQLYFPKCFDQIIKIFDAIRTQVNKEKIKNQLKGNVKKQESNYTIDDVDLMNGNEFEHFICELFNKMGYKSNVTKQSGDQGLDVIAVKNGKRIGIQAKCYSYTVGNSAVQEAVAGKNYYHCDKVLVITNNYFTSSAKELAQVNDVILWNRDILIDKINNFF